MRNSRGVKAYLPEELKRKTKGASLGATPRWKNPEVSAPAAPIQSGAITTRTDRGLKQEQKILLLPTPEPAPTPRKTVHKLPVKGRGRAPTPLPVQEKRDVETLPQLGNTAYERSGLSRDEFDTRVRKSYASREPQTTGGELGALTRALNSGEVRLSAGQKELTQLKTQFELMPSEEKGLAYNTRYQQYQKDLEDYIDALEGYQRYYSAEEIKGRAEDIAGELEELREKHRDLSSYAGVWFEGWQPDQEKLMKLTGGKEIHRALAETNAAILEKERQYGSLLSEYYTAQNEEKLAALMKNAGGSEQYDWAKSLQEDMDKVVRVAGDALDHNGGQASVEDRDYLSKKYGLTQSAIDHYISGGAQFRPSGEEGYANLWELYEELEQKLESAKGTLSEGGYDYERLTGYEKSLKDRQAYEKKREEWQQWADDHPVLSSADTVVAAPFQAVDYFKSVGMGLGHSDVKDLDSYVPLNVYEMDATNYVNTVRGTVTQKLEENTDWKLFGKNVASFLYQTGMSVADSAVQVAALGSGATLLMGASAASNQAKNIIERGGTNSQAFWGGLAAGAAETFFETFSVEQLLKPKSLDTWKVLLKETAKQAGVEASEEMFTEIANILSDAAVMGATSDFAVMTKEHQKGGVSKEAAERRAFLDCVGQVAWAGAGGAISGGIMGGVTNLAGYIKQTRALGSGGNRMELLPGARRSGGGLPPLAKGSRAGAPIKLNSVDSAVFGGYDGIKKGGVSDEAARASAQRQEADSGGGVSGLSERVGEVERAGIFGREDSFASGFIRLSDESLAKIAQSGVVGVDLEDRSADSAAFSSALEAARAADSRNGWAVTPKTAEELSGDKVLLSKSGASGLAVTPDGDIVAVFNNKAAGGPKGATKVLIPTAVANGGVKLDCYGADLVDIYAQYGFVPVARVAFDAEYANEGWTPDKGTPDIYFMVHNGDRADVVVDKMGQYPQYALEQLQGLPLMDYEGAAAYRDSLLSKIAPTDGAVIAQKPASTGEAVKADTSRFDSGILANLNKARKYFIEYAKTHFPASVVNVETGTEIGISRTGLDKFLSGRIAKEKYASGFYIPELIERARKVGQADNYHVKKVRSIPTYEYYDSPISIDGMDYIAHIRVKNTTMGDKYYGHTISEVEDIKIEPSARTPASETPTG